MQVQALEDTIERVYRQFSHQRSVRFNVPLARRLFQFQRTMGFRSTRLSTLRHGRLHVRPHLNYGTFLINQLIVQLIDCGWWW